jgi:hypothetical protein
MTHITSISAGMFSDLSVSMPTADVATATLEALNSAAGFTPYFATEIEAIGGTRGTNTFVRVKNVREFPAMGVPANIVNVPTYGKASSSQVQGQSDNPNLEVTLNFLPSTWAKEAGNLLGNMVGDSVMRLWRFSLLTAKPTLTTTAQYASTTAGLGSVPNSQWFFLGKLEALQFNPQLTDANTATITLSQQSELFGAYTST